MATNKCSIYWRPVCGLVADWNNKGVHADKAHHIIVLGETQLIDKTRWGLTKVINNQFWVDVNYLLFFVERKKDEVNCLHHHFSW